MKPNSQSLLSPIGINVWAVSKPETKTKQTISEGYRRTESAKL